MRPKRLKAADERVVDQQTPVTTLCTTGIDGGTNGTNCSDGSHLDYAPKLCLRCHCKQNGLDHAIYYIDIVLDA